MVHDFGLEDGNIGPDYGVADTDRLIWQASILASSLTSSGIASRDSHDTSAENDTDIYTTYGNSSNASSGVAYLGDQLFEGYSSVLLNFATFCCIVFILVGIPGNLITIIALLRCKKVRNATAVFIINLSVSDLMFCCFNLPLAASMFWQRAWCHGELLCQLFPLTRYGLVAVSLFTVLAITINRYVMIGHPRLYPKLYRKQYLGLMVACTWVFGFGALVATWFGKWGMFGLDKHIGSCSILPDAHGRSPKEFLFLVAFVIPCLAIVVCYARIFYIVRKTALRSRLTTTSRSSNNTTMATSSMTNSTTTSKSDRRLRSLAAEDSALGSTSTSAGPTITTDKVSFMENGHTSPCNNNKTEQIPDEGVAHLSPSPHLLSPPSPNHLRIPRKVVLAGEPSSSSGVDTVATGNDDYDEDDYNSSRSVTPSSLCSSSMGDLGGDRGTNGEPGGSKQRRRRRRDRGESSSGVNSALSHMTSVFRRGSQMKNNSPRRQSTAVAGLATPGKMTAKDKKLLKMILVIFVSFVVCYLPITISKTFKTTMDIHELNIAGYILIYLTTCINPIIYVVMSSEYRQAYKNLLMCRGYGPDNANQQGGQGVGPGGRSVSQRA